MFLHFMFLCATVATTRASFVMTALPPECANISWTQFNTSASTASMSFYCSATPNTTCPSFVSACEFIVTYDVEDMYITVTTLRLGFDLISGPLVETMQDYFDVQLPSGESILNATSFIVGDLWTVYNYYS